MESRSNNSELTRLFNPIQLGDVTLRNRIVCSPVSINCATSSGAVTADVIDFYVAMGSSGVGLVTIGATSVSEEGSATQNSMHIGPPELTPGLRELSEAIRRTGAKSQ